MNRAAVTALVAAACLVAPAAASASVQSTLANRRADHAALSAYATYLQALVAAKPAGVAAEQLFTSDTASICYKALEPITTAESVPAGTSTALTSIGDEIGADAGLEFRTIAATPMTQLATTLDALHWGTAGPAATVKRFVEAHEAISALQPSNLCGDADSVAAQADEQQVTVPPATQTFLDTYEADSSMANARLTAFVKLLDSYATSADRQLATRIDQLAVKVSAISAVAITAGTKSLFHALGIPAAPNATASAAAAGA